MSLIDKGAIAGDKDRFKTGEGGGSSFFAPKEGEHKVFVCPPARGAKMPYYATAVHYTGDAGILCADPNKNPLLKDPIFLAALKAEGKTIPSECSLCKGKDKPGTKFMHVIVPLQYKAPGGEFKRVDSIEVRPYLSPKQVWNGIADILLDVGDSVVDVMGPVFVKIKREGKTKNNTKYTVIADTKTLREQKALPKGIRDLIAEALAEDGPADPYKILARMFKAGDEMTAAAGGLNVDTDEEDIFGDDGDDEGKASGGDTSKTEPAAKAEPAKKGVEKKRPPCFAIDYQPDDTACQSCKILGECQAEAERRGATASDDGDDGDEGDEGGEKLETEGKGDDLDDLLGT